ncbi:MAG: hypothetical protein U9R72_03300, partial [Chloroflexota bacterium]|nr:hypothetical protein [Chloroflexota bacterium]
GNNRWQWVFETPQASYHVIADSRGSRVIEGVLGDAKPQVWVSDCFSAQERSRSRLIPPADLLDIALLGPANSSTD